MGRKNWVVLHGQDVIKAVRKAKVPVDGFVGTSVYVPAWVESAINMYNQNEGYAGMDLAEFLAFFRETNNK